MENKCVICGAVIPEGRRVCKNCDLVHRPIKSTPDAKIGIQLCDKCKYKLRCDECVYNGKDIAKLIDEENKKAIESFARVVIEDFNFYKDDDMFSKKLIVDSILNRAKVFGVKIDDGE